MLLIAGGSDAHRAAAQSAMPTRAPLGLDVSLPAAKRLAGARELIAAGDWDAAIRSLELLTDEFGESLIEVEPRRYVNVRRAAAATLARLPPAGLAAYRRRIDPALEPLYREAAARQDPALMQQIVSDGFASSVGDDALDWLAESALQAGECDRARVLWTVLLPLPAANQAPAPAVLRYPDADLAPAEICARLVLCSLLEGDAARARGELALFEAKFGQATGALVGGQGPLARTLAALIDEAANWQPTVARSGGAGSTMAGANAAPRLTGILWSQALPDALAVAGAGQAPACRPSVWNDAVLISTPLGVGAWKIASGESRWSAGGDDRGLLDAPNLLVPERAFVSVGVPRYAGQVADGRWYGRRGSLVSVAAVRAPSLPPSELVCLNLDAEGRLEWAVGSDELTQLAGARFSGPPLVVDGRLYAAVRRAAPQIEIGMACFDASDGTLRWQRPLCAALESQPLLRHRIHDDVLAAGGGLVFQCPGAGVIAARAADSGELRWAVTYDAVAGSPDSGSEVETPSALLCEGGRLFVKPGDSNQLLALSADDGRLLWSVRCPGWIRDLLGIDAGRLIAGGDQLWGFDIATGDAWRFGYDDPEGHGFGRGVLAGGRAYWTTRDDLFVVEAATGRLLERIDLARDVGLTGGNLAIAGDTLLIASPARVTALGPRPGG